MLFGLWCLSPIPYYWRYRLYCEAAAARHGKGRSQIHLLRRGGKSRVRLLPGALRGTEAADPPGACHVRESRCGNYRTNGASSSAFQTKRRLNHECGIAGNHGAGSQRPRSRAFRRESLGRPRVRRDQGGVAGRGDTHRGRNPLYEGYGPSFRALNRNKRSLTLDLRKPRGKEILLKLVEKADILLENFRPETRVKLGLDYERLSELNPRLIHCSITGYGQEGPYRDKPGFDTIGQALSGMLSLMTDFRQAQGGGGLRHRPFHRRVRRLRHPRGAAGAPPHRPRPVRRCVAAAHQPGVHRVPHGRLPERRRGHHPGELSAGTHLLLCSQRQESPGDPSFRTPEGLGGAGDRGGAPGPAGRASFRHAKGPLGKSLRYRSRSCRRSSRRSRGITGSRPWTRSACPTRRSTRSTRCWTTRR